MTTASSPYISSELLQAFTTVNACAVSVERCLKVTELMFQLCCGVIFPDMELSIEQVRAASQHANSCVEQVLEAVHRDDLIEA